jgi:twitching motility protein PilI
VQASSAPAPAPRAAAVPLEASVVTLNNALEVNCGLQVDSLAGLRGADAFAASSAAAEGAPAFFGNCFVDAEGQRWQEIDLRALARSAPFLSIGA